MIEDTANDFRFPTQMKTTTQRLRSLCATPLMTGNKVLGVVRISAVTPGIFNSDHLRLLDVFSNLGSVTLKNLLLYAKMEEMAIHDSLTGLYLNRHFKESFSQERRRADHGRQSFSLIMIDVDYFKQCNDDYGHSAGDIVLKDIAAIIQSCIEPLDFAARYGGEEFIVMLPNKNKKEAMDVAEQIRSEIEIHSFVFRRNEVRVTASLGVVSYPEEAGSEEDLLRMVDQHLYHAKRLGRNRVCGNL
jgi:diguanylate cyclase (GGDEF)-like protein